ncbi:alcohol dehydrogenase catalytic domain-containing protein [Alkalihalobacillus sp. MEB130]|uniref:zinc-dependent alcohol dehydrogenase n=1 Tax=Alkalihalobacillus sp. MEB130 TaxID=2976704 RepID=UPI0028DDCD3D|nr:alcohol dehydrogenase catalytic domain-containing protein [Alkalihalobacillus sp. MEB130]MDT8861470.1 alcohol dehydrogenase catalytic domain-containing protein [Alkalihalobacillus sp. MEB130]
MLGLFLKNPRKIELRELTSSSFLKDDEVKIKVIYGGICGSDISVYKGSLAHATYPLHPGHELVGEVIETGKDAAEMLGKRVVVAPNSFCGECEYCLKGKPNICSHKKSLGVNSDGGFLQEFTISAKYVIEVPDELSNEKAVIIEPFAVIVHALQKVDISEKTSVAVIGCGTEGMLAITLADYLGAQITAIDINENKFKKVQMVGNIQTARPDEVSGHLFDVVIEAAGARASVEQAIELVKPGGALVMVGMTAEATFPVLQIVRKELTLYGSIIYNFPQDFEKSINYLLDDHFKVDAIIEKICDLKDYEQAYEDAVSGQFGKIIINFKEET